ncbi:HalOD1 output domain-containing protein [Natronoarchaeum rubrum]|uniref:HalOD1 output domain-containing protein n=1 Tax=Natronoarchaeum rubrum TaxID=755311 RepID=UPI002113127B|nr:HalOD1 output domain-containing protein [Natronoarchaeum rubrum]
MDWSGRTNVDRRGDEIALRVLEGVADADDRRISDLPPLYSTLDPDALGALFRRSDSDLRVVFEYDDKTVTVREGGRVTVDEGF